MTKQERYSYRHFKKRAKQRLINEKKIYKERCKTYKEKIKQGIL